MTAATPLRVPARVLIPRGNARSFIVAAQAAALAWQPPDDPPDVTPTP